MNAEDMNAEERLTSAIDDAYALARLLDGLTDGLDMEVHYIGRQLQRNADQLRASFQAFCDDVNNELRAAKGAAA